MSNTAQPEAYIGAYCNVCAVVSSPYQGVVHAYIYILLPWCVLKGHSTGRSLLRFLTTGPIIRYS